MATFLYLEGGTVINLDDVTEVEFDRPTPTRKGEVLATRIRTNRAWDERDKAGNIVRKTATYLCAGAEAERVKAFFLGQCINADDVEDKFRPRAAHVPVPPNRLMGVSTPEPAIPTTLDPELQLNVTREQFEASKAQVPKINFNTVREKLRKG